MKKITLFFMFAILGAFTFSSYAQTLNQNASWPNAAWSVTGTYNTDPLAFEADPTTTANFAFDDDDAGSGSDDIIAAESPVIDLTAAFNAGETWLSISGNFVYNYNDDDILQFEYWDADASSWNIIGLPIDTDTTAPPLDNFCSGTSEAYTSEILNIVGFSATQLSGFRYRIYFDDLVGGAGYEWGFCFQSPTISSETPPACPDPSVLTATGILDTMADLSWIESGSATAWDVEIVTSGSAATGTPTTAGVTNPYTAMTLTENTLYDYYVRANCGVDGTSAWVGPFTFRTACAAIATPYTEDFETFTTAGTAFTTENCWAGTGGAYFWESAPGTDTGSAGTGPDPTITTGNYFYTEATGGASGDITDLVSPLVDLSSLTTPSVAFNYHMFGMQMGTLDVLVNGTTNVFTISGQQQTSATADWELAVIDLTAFAGQSISITFRATSAGTYEGDMAIDNVNFNELPACILPNGLTATNIDGFSADLGWTEGGTATSWNIELVDITAAGTVTGTATSLGVTNPFNVTGLVPANDYEFYVQADCGVDGVSDWAGPFAFTTTIACPEPSMLTATNIMTTSADLGWTAGASETVWDIEIVDVTAGGTVTGTATALGVANPYNASGLVDNNSYTFYVKADCGTNGASTWVGPFAFVTACNAFTAPYTQDFESAGALPGCWNQGGDEDWKFANTGAGNHIGNNGTLNGNTTSGGYFAWVDDSDPTATNAELSSALVDVSGLTTPALSFYEIRDNEGFGNATLTVSVWDGAAWNTVGTYATNTIGWEQKIIDLSGLTFTGPAQARFSVADSGSFYDDVAIDDVTFDELPTCLDPSMLTAINITNSSADLGWAENGTGSLWNIELVDVTAAGTVTGTATAIGVSNPYLLTGLTENNEYSFYVQSDCGAGGLSAWVGPFAFTTLETCPAPSGLGATGITLTTAALEWTENGGATSWNIELVNNTAGEMVTGTATETGVTSPYSATGLVGDSSYSFYVQADCGSGDVSAWTGPFTFATPYVAVPASCSSEIFLDSGGVTGDYTSGENVTYTIMPDTAGDIVSVLFNAFSAENNGTGCYDGLTIYDGPDATATTIDPPAGGSIWCWDRDDATPSGSGDLEGMTITSSHASGALTFVFSSDGSATREGWEATVICTTLSVDDFDNGLAFTYFPNPVNDSLVLKAQKEMDNISVYNMLGQEVLRAAPNTVNAEVNMSDLQSGAYFVKVTIDNATETVRVIKN
ncbi:T9SS type A sorting domain-containing protein [Lacinutrix sp. MEBiC02595]